MMTVCISEQSAQPAFVSSSKCSERKWVFMKKMVSLSDKQHQDTILLCLSISGRRLHGKVSDDESTAHLFFLCSPVHPLTPVWTLATNVAQLAVKDLVQ